MLSYDKCRPFSRDFTEKRGWALKIGIYGGTFNPIHLGHMEAARFAREYLELDRL